MDTIIEKPAEPNDPKVYIYKKKVRAVSQPEPKYGELGVRFKYVDLVTNKGMGKLCVAYRPNGSQMEVAFSFCSPKDHFSKKGENGRRKLLERLNNKGPFYVTAPIPETETPLHIVATRLVKAWAYLNSNLLPMWTEAAYLAEDVDAYDNHSAKEACKSCD